MIKKFILFIIILFILFSINLFADDDLFKAFQLSYIFLDSIDISSTLYGVKLGLTETNPFGKLYIKDPLLTYAIHFVLDIAIIKFTDIIYKGNKRFSWVIIVGLNLIKSYVVYRNFKILWG